MSVNMGSAIAFLELDTSKFSSGFKTALNDLKVFGDSSATSTQKLDGLSNSMKVIGTTLTKTVTAPLVAVGALAVNSAMKFESGMAEVKAISGSTATEMEQLSDKAREMGENTKFSATEAADAFKYMAMAGWDSQSMLDGISGIMDLAAASGEDLAATSDIVTDALTAFGLQASDSAHFADVLAQASSSSNTNVGLMGATFKYVAPVAGALGYSIEDTAVAIGLMANAGIKGEQAGTALRSMLTRLVKPTKQSQQAIDDLGLSITNSDGTMKPLNETLVQMREKFAGLTEEQKAEYAALIAGQEGMSGLLAIVNASSSDFETLTAQIDNSNGAAKNMADTMMNTTEGAIIQLKSALESAGITIGQRLTPYIRSGAEWVTKLTKKINSLSDEQVDSIVKFAGMAAAMGPVLLIGSKLLKTTSSMIKGIVGVGSAVKTGTTLFKLLTTTGINPATMAAAGLSEGTIGLVNILAGLLNPVGLLIGTMTVFGAALLYAEKQEEKEIEKLAELTDTQKELSEEIARTSDAYQSVAENREKSIENANIEAEQTRNLWSELQTIVDANGVIKKGYEDRASVITGELSQALGQEISIVDGVVQGYQDLSASIEDTINKQKALAIQDALKADYAEALRNRIDAQKQYNEALSEYSGQQSIVAGIQEELNTLNSEYNNGVGLSVKELGEYSGKKGELNKELEAEKKHLKDLKKDMNKAEEAYIGYSETIDNYSALNEALVSGEADAIEMALLKIEQGFITAKNGTRKALQDQTKDLEAQYRDMQSKLESGAEGVTQEMVDQLGQLVEQSNAELDAKIEETRLMLLTKFDSLGMTMTEGLKEQLENATPEVQEQTLNLLDAIGSGVSLTEPELNALFSNLGMNVPKELILQLGKLNPSVQRQAIDLLQQLQYGEESKRPQVLQQMRDLGIKVDDSLAKGIKSNEPTVKSSAGSVGTNANTEMGSKLRAKDLKAPNLDGRDAVRQAASIGESIRSSLQGVLNKGATIYANVVQQVNGKHADGLAYVPFNGYIAELHKGERVLTAEENKAYNRGIGSNVGGDVFNFYNTKPDPYEYSRQMKQAKRALKYNL